MAFESPKYFASSSFVNQVLKEFGPVAAEGRLVGPITENYRVIYTSRKFSIEVVYDDSDGRVVTVVGTVVRGRHVRASLSCLYVEARLGAAQEVREIARSRHSLVQALGSQATAIRDLIAVLLGPGRESVMLACRGR